MFPPETISISPPARQQVTVHGVKSNIGHVYVMNHQNITGNSQRNATEIQLLES